MACTQERTQLIDKIRRLPGQNEYLAGALSTEELTGQFVAGE
jgi:hypothetical protein